METGQKPTGYSRWNKNRLNEFIKSQNLPLVVEDGKRLRGRKQLLKSVGRYAAEFKNIRTKTKLNLQSLINKYNITKVEPTGRKGDYLKKDYETSIRNYWKPINSEQIKPVDFGGVLPMRFGKVIQNYEIQIHRSNVDYIIFFRDNRVKIRNKMIEIMATTPNFNFELRLKVTLNKINVQDEFEDKVITFKSKRGLVLDSSEISSALNANVENLKVKLQEFETQKSGWSVAKLNTLYLNFTEYRPLRGGSYIELPKFIKSKKAVINVQNTDDECVRWSLRAALGKFKDKVKNEIMNNPKYEIKYERATIYFKEDGLNFNGISFPTPINQIPKIEKQNGLNINIFAYDEN